MAKRLTMAEIDAILTLHTTGHSNREIATLLGRNRETVGKYVDQAGARNQPNAPTGTDAVGGDRDAAAVENQPDQPTVGAPPTGSAGPPPNRPASNCEPFREEIQAKVEQGLEAVRIHLDLLEAHGEGAPSYYSVRRFVARLKHKTPLPFRRMETEPGEEAQVDFGTGAPVRTAEGKLRRPWVFRIILSYSRKAYYSVPPEFVGHRLWVRWDGRLVRVFNDRWEQIAVHAKAEPGRFRTAAEHIPTEKVSAVERGTDALLRQVATNRSIKKKQIYDLAAGGFVRQHRDVLLAGPPGVGKSHLLQALSRRYCEQGFRVRYTTSADLLEDLRASLADQTLPRRVRYWSRFDLVVIDEFGFDRIERSECPQAANLFYKVIDARSGKRSTALATNIDFDAWSEYLGDPPLAMAFLDRIVDGAILLKIRGKSYRAHRVKKPTAGSASDPT